MDWSITLFSFQDPVNNAQGTTNGTYKKKQYFTCCGLFVSFDRLSEDPLVRRFRSQNKTQCGHQDIKPKPLPPVEPNTALPTQFKQIEPRSSPVAGPSAAPSLQFKEGDRVVIFGKKGTRHSWNSEMGWAIPI